jgi:quercetin dioxygenase-like cupin family protein
LKNRKANRLWMIVDFKSTQIRTPRLKVEGRLVGFSDISLDSDQSQFDCINNNYIKKVDDMMENAVKTELLAKAIDMAGLAAYQGHSVVSREIIRKPTGTVSVFAFDEGEGLSDHTAPFDALVYILEGKAEIFIDGKLHHLGQGQMIIMPAGHPHALKAVTRFKMMLVLVK